MKHRLFKLALFLLLGAIVNVAVAWYWILFVPFVPTSFGFGDEIKDRLPKYVFVRSDLFDFNEGGSMNRGYRHYFIFGTEVDSKGVDSALPLYMQWEAGWPMHSLDGSFFMTADGLDQAFAFYVPESWFDHVENYVLPFRPILLGFAINTIFYATILWLLTLGPFTARRMIRHKRGRCIKCGYDLRNVKHEKCPECGCELIARVKS